LRAVLLAGFLSLVVLGALPLAWAQVPGRPIVTLTNQYIVNAYGYAVMNETIRYNNTGSTPVQIPTAQLGLPGNISSRIVGDYSISGDGYTLTTSNSNGLVLITIGTQATLQPSSVSVVSVKAVVRDILVLNKTVTSVLVLEYPSVNLQIDTLSVVLQMPPSTFVSPIPKGWSTSQNSSRTFYRTTLTALEPQSPRIILGPLQSGSTANFNPIHVYAARRTVTAASNGAPQVQDSVTVKNTGTTSLSSLRLAMLNSSSRVTVTPSASPPLLNPTRVTLSNGAIDLTKAPFVPVPGGQNFTVTVVYGLPSRFYTVSGGSVLITIPLAPPISAPVDSYTLSTSLPNGVTPIASQARVVLNATPLTAGSQTFGYSLTLGWASDRAIPVASVIFLASLFAFFVSTPASTEEVEEGEISGDVSDMVKAFEDKVDLTNGILQEVASADPSNANRAYFDELRGRLDTFRSRALQRLNEAKQKSGSERFSAHLNRIHDTEREVDRATRDVLNLYEQYQMKRMRQETFEKLLPNYRKRLGTAMNQLSDELNLAQREAKTL